MKYNSIGEQLIAKAKELDPNYKPDKFNDMSEAIDILLNNSGGGGGIPVIEGTESATTTDGAYTTYTIPEAQTSCFIFKCDLGAAFISYNDVFGTYNGYLDAEGDVTDGSLKLNDLIVLNGSGTTIDIFFGRLGSDGGGGNIVTIKVTSMPDTQTTIDVSAITNDTQFVNIKETSTNKNYLLYRVGDDFASSFSNELAQGKIVAYYYIGTRQKQLYCFISSVGKIGKIFGNHDIQVPAVSSNNILPCTTADNGKVLSVVNGEAQWASASGGGGIPVIEGTITFNEGGNEYTVSLSKAPTGNNFILYNTNYTDNFLPAYLNMLTWSGDDYMGSWYDTEIIGSIITNGTSGSAYVTGAHYISQATTAEAGSILTISEDHYPKWKLPSGSSIPSLPADASNSTYVLKAINGTVQWVKES